MTKEAILAFSQGQAEPQWLLERRLAAVENMAELELPVIERVKFHRWQLTPSTIGQSWDLPSVPDFLAIGDNPKLVQVGSQTVLEQLPTELIDKGVVLTDLATVLEERPELLETYLGQACPDDSHRLAAYNTAYFTSGAILYVPDGVEIDQPIEISLLEDRASAQPFVKKILVIAGKNSKFSYLERLESLGKGTEAASANVSVEIIAGSGSQIKYAAIDHLGSDLTGYVSRQVYHHEDATVDWAMGVMNGGNVVCDFDSRLHGRGSHANLKVVALSSGRQVQGVDTSVTNYGAHSVGHILQHGVILERGTLTFNGIGHIIKGAKGADAQQESRVLMLSDQARSDANPILLIDENEVTAGHAASIGQVDPEDMYYLMSRGLDRATAERLVIRGFLGAVITEIPVKDVRDEMIQTIDDKLEKW
ncbi:Fe-S cluster assembly protein SufD [Streptococcus entericus]|uniref:Fe-S cluster assembly protein SufD n=1 Tax=Streptococcus entericus TaxID=155680 RepID=UPI000379FD9D|nr:Fe-S cluster assembly protein SufD [Streptococcus entericus]